MGGTSGYSCGKTMVNSGMSGRSTALPEMRTYINLKLNE